MHYDFIAFIGRFEPFHNGHLSVVQRALQTCDRLIVLIGSSQSARSTRNPFSSAEREVMLRAALGRDADRVIVRHIPDHLYNEGAWQADVQRNVSDAVTSAGKTLADARIGLIGHEKDESSWYLHAFPQWDLIDVAFASGLSATELREHLFSQDDGALRLVEANVPTPVFETLLAFRKTKTFAQLAEEFRHISDYKAAWAAAPYPPTFTTVDAVVVHSGHVLLVKRGAQPGKGLWALPGGFVNQQETLLTAALRELKEETRIKLPLPVLRGSLKGQRVFDEPDRSQRGRTITHAFYFEFPSGDLPQVRGADDAARARWVSLAEARQMRELLFEDHYFIIEHFIGAA
ncbi:bifunctional nicotinamide-nucleotide adenylyltransferase/Nudix hydroxylase [Asticcacaulis sp. 201]|uniref:bifunctional nicotinamide-nucleotide adenylyltransferase/Nudix hydroxylase n=1 Tax=Asticcacaulis sp. 201 TaxID=3028787 RepID=UPI002916FD46|nr:bifunctional nicotinamide-nucleotide adenylyltransferase/Nudix hydroxylase [Asticcacaulis sp. 201]MDV6329957.1 bifunctional nicotinamide-nucleotide adenylyltransferase/Nudix hydroxylase [Asticcacaulis sp. 201]